MKYCLEVKNADAFFEKLKNDNAFTCEEGISGLNLRYNAVITLISNPKISIFKKSDTQIEMNIIPGFLLYVIAVFFTLFFWAIGIIAILYGRLNTGLIITAFLMPSLLWILQIIFNKVINKQILEEIQKYI